MLTSVGLNWHTNDRLLESCMAIAREELSKTLPRAGFLFACSVYCAPSDTFSNQCHKQGVCTHSLKGRTLEQGSV